MFKRSDEPRTMPLALENSRLAGEHHLLEAGGINDQPYIDFMAMRTAGYLDGLKRRVDDALKSGTLSKMDRADQSAYLEISKRLNELAKG